MTPVHLVGALAAFVALRASLRTGLTVMLGAVFLVPNNLTLAGFPPSLPIVRIVILSFAAGLVLKVRAGTVPVDVLRPTRVHIAFVAFLAVALVNGILLNQVDNLLNTAGLIWFTLADQLVVFALVLAAARVLGPWSVGRIVAALVVATAAIAAGEHLTGGSYARRWFELADRLRPGSVAAQELVERGGELRVRAASQFALEYAWVGAMALPLVAVVASRSRRLIALGGPALLTLAIVWTVSRSAFFGIALGLLAAVAASRFDRRLTALTVTGAVVGGLVFLAVPSLRDSFDAANPDSVASRSRRLTFVTAEVESQPYTGLGLAGLRARGIRGTDSGYSLIYAGTGVPGLTALAALLITTAVVVAGGVRHRDPEERAMVGAAFGGVAVGIAAGLALNSLTVAGSARTLWIIAALGVAGAEAARADRAAVTQPWTAGAVAGRLMLPIGGVAVGVAIAVLAPTHVAARYRFSTITPAAAISSRGAGAFAGRLLVKTACEVVDAVRTTQPASVDCQDPRDAPALGELRVEARSHAALDCAADEVAGAARRALPPFAAFEVDRAEGTPTGLRTAPVWLGALGAAAAVLLPRRRAGPPATVAEGGEPAPAAE